MTKKSQHPLVSIIIPTYGTPETLKESVDSVLNQKYSAFEVIVVDDNNPNTAHRKETEKLIQSNYSLTTNVKYLKHIKNKNGSAARNTGIAEAKGKYVCFLDDDDYFLPGKLSTQVEYLNRHPEFDAVYCGYRVNGVEHTQDFKGQLTKELLLLEYEPVTSSLMFRMEAIQAISGFDESFVRHQDYELMLRFFENHKVSYIDGVFIDKGRTDDSNIVRGEKLEELKEYFLTTFEKEINALENKEAGIKKRIYSRHYSYVFLTHMNHGYYKRGLGVFFKFFFKFPIIFTRDLIRRVREYIKN